MINLSALWDIFKAGKMVKDAVALKDKQKFAAAFTTVAGLALGYAKAKGYDLPISNEDLIKLGAAASVFFGLFNTYATVASTDKVGLLSNKQPAGASESPVPAVVEDEPPAPMQPDPHTAARVGEQFVDAENPLAGLDTTYRG
jgi:hypothetical protein